MTSFNGLLIFFFARSDPKKRFKFFLKATQVDTAIEKLNDCGSHYTAAKKHFEFQKTLLKTAKEELSKIQAKYDSLQSIGYLKVCPSDVFGENFIFSCCPNRKPSTPSKLKVAG